MSEEDKQPLVEPRAVQELRVLVEKARAGDESVLPELRKALDDDPELSEHFGGLSQHLEAQWFKLLAGGDLCVREALARKAKAMREDLELPTILERLLVDAVIATWLESQYFGAVLVASGNDGSLRQGESLQLRRDASNRRFLAAIKSLAEVRKLLRTTLSSGPSRVKRKAAASEKANIADKTAAGNGSADRSTIPMKPRKKR